MKHRQLLLVGLIYGVAFASVAIARSTGITGYTLKGNATRCVAYPPNATKTAILTLSVPSAFKVNETKACTVVVPGSTTGIDVAVFSGTLTPDGTLPRRSMESSPEVRHRRIRANDR